MSGTVRCGRRRFADPRPTYAGASTTSAGKKLFTRPCDRVFLSVHLCIGCASQKFSLARAPQKLISFYNHPAARKNYIRHARDLDALKHGVIHAHVVRLGADGVFALGVEYHQVGVTAGGDRPLARVQYKEFGWRRRNQLYKSVRTVWT